MPSDKIAQQTLFYRVLLAILPIFKPKKIGRGTAGGRPRMSSIYQAGLIVGKVLIVGKFVNAGSFCFRRNSRVGQAELLAS